MKKYNDYIQTVIRYLSRNDELRTYLQHLEAEKAAREERLKTIMHPITAQYSLIAGCSKGNIEKSIFFVENVYYSYVTNINVQW